MPRRKNRYVSYYDASIDDETLDNELASSTSDGLMSKEDKIKLDSIQLGSIDGEKQVINKPTHFDFPSIGSVDCIYKAYNERKTYQWNEELLKYETLNESSMEEINLINGGNAYGNEN